MSDKLKSEFDGSVMALFVIGTIIIPFIGIFIGLMNLQYPERNGQSQLLLGLGCLMALINYFLIYSGI